jgi:hypothetical protein
MKPVVIVLSRAKREMRERDGGDEPKVYCKYIWKCQKEFPCTTNMH